MAMPTAEYIIWLGASGLKLLYSRIEVAMSRGDWSRRQISTRPMPLSRVARGSSSGSEYGAHFRTTRWATPASRARPSPYPAMPAGTLPSMARPTLRYANTGMTTANASSASSVLRRLGASIAPMVVVLVTTLMVVKGPLRVLTACRSSRPASAPPR
ncbi:hypothetical protein SNARM312S_01970 [Streptomyces narbonensis]